MDSRRSRRRPPRHPSPVTSSLRVHCSQRVLGAASAGASSTGVFARDPAALDGAREPASRGAARATRGTPGSESYASNSSQAAASDFAVDPATPTPTTKRPRRLQRCASGHVVGVARDDHDVREVGQAEHVLDGVDGEADVGAVLGVRRGGEELHEVDRARDELRAVDRVDRRRPVGVGAREHERAEGCRVVDDRADVDRRGGQTLGDLGLVGVLDDPLAVARVGVAAVHAVVPGHDDVVEVEVDGDAAVLRGRACQLPPRGSARRSSDCRHLVERPHDRDGLVDRQHVAVGAALGDVALRGERLVLHAAALDSRFVLLEHGAVGRHDAERGRAVPDPSMSMRASVPMMCAVLVRRRGMPRSTSRGRRRRA